MALAAVSWFRRDEQTSAVVCSFSGYMYSARVGCLAGVSYEVCVHFFSHANG